MRSAALRACIIRGAEPYRPNQRRSARHPYRSRTIAARCAALILRAPLLIRLRFASDPSGWRPRYHPLRFARIIRYAPRRAARDTRTASRMPVSWRDSLRADKARHPAPDRLRRFDHARFNPRLPGGRRPLRSRPLPFVVVSIHAFRGEGDPTPTLRARRRPERARSQPEARTARAPVRRRVSWRAHRPVYQTASFNPRLPGGRRPHTEKPVPRAPVRRRVWWRAHRRTFTPTDTIRAGASRRFNPRLPGGRRPHTEKPVPRAPVRRRVSWRAHRPAYQPAPTLRAGTAQNAPGAAQNAPGASQKPVPRQKPGRSQPEARTAPEAGQKRAPRQTPPGTRQEPAASAYRALLRFSTITDPVRIRLRRPGIAQLQQHAPQLRQTTPALSVGHRLRSPRPVTSYALKFRASRLLLSPSRPRRQIRMQRVRLSLLDLKPVKKPVKFSTRVVPHITELSALDLPFRRPLAHGARLATNTAPRQIRRCVIGIVEATLRIKQAYVQLCITHCNTPLQSTRLYHIPWYNQARDDKYRSAIAQEHGNARHHLRSCEHRRTGR